jgi:hypothetical protein
MTPAESDLASARNEHDHATLTLWTTQSELLRAAASGDDGRVETWRRVLAADARTLSLAEDLRTAAFAVLAAERAAASPVRLVPRELTPVEASALAAAEERLDTARTILGRDESFDCGLQRGLLRAIESGAESYAEECREAIVSGYAYTDRARANVTAALDARAPLLAARWQEAAT